jgi:hypothetical protein
MAFAIALILAIAVWKPWDTGRDAGAVVPGSPPTLFVAPDSPAPSPLTPTPPTPTPAPPADPDAIACIGDIGWRAVTRDVTAGRESRTWIAVDPTKAGGPADESIPVVRVVVGRLTAIGYCVPAELSGKPRREQLWRFEPAVGDPVSPGTPKPERPRATPSPVAPLQALGRRAAGYADMFGPPHGEASWAAGRYVFAVDLGGSAGRVWFTIEVIDSAPVPDL